MNWSSAMERKSVHKTPDLKGENVNSSLLTVPKLARSVSLHDAKCFERVKKDSGEFVLTTGSEGDLVRYFLSPTHIRRSASVHDYHSEQKSPLVSKGTLSDDEVFEFPHSRSPISLKVILLLYPFFPEFLKWTYFHP